MTIARVQGVVRRSRLGPIALALQSLVLSRVFSWFHGLYSSGNQQNSTGRSSFRGALHQFYTDIRATLRNNDSDYIYVSEMEASEDRIMDAFHSVLKDSSTPEATRETVMGYLPKVKAQHDSMRDRKWPMQAEQRH